MKKTQKSFNSTLRKTSMKQSTLERKRSKVKAERLAYLLDKYGYYICEYCGKRGIVGDDMDNPRWLGMHEIDGNHQNCSPENLYICHNECHDKIDKKILVEQEDFQNRQLWG